MINTNSQFYQDLQTTSSVNLGMYNLIISIHDVALYAKGMKRNNLWSFNNVKKYFGVKGNAESVLKQLQDIKKFIYVNSQVNKISNIIFKELKR